MKVHCKYCGYEWESRVDHPLACTKCKRYLPVKEVEHEEVENEQ
jgi:predicted Zn-ribbon and HTH transcriptional regulator